MSLDSAANSKAPALTPRDWRAQLRRLARGLGEGFSEGASSLVASGDEDELLRAALRRKADQYVREQENIEAVTRLAEEKLKEAPPLGEGEPSAAFMHRFQKEAVNATSEDAREMFSRALAGEFQKPGSFSFLALDTLANLDQKLATSIDFIAPFIGSMDGTVGLEIAKDHKIYEHLIRLQSRGLMMSSTSKLTVKSGTLIYVGESKEPASRTINLDISKNQKLILQTGGDDVSWESYLLTDVGREIMSLRQVPVSEAGLSSMVDVIKKVSGVRRINLMTAPPAPSEPHGNQLLYERPLK